MSNLEDTIFNAFSEGRVEGLSEDTKPEDLKTQISHLFFYPGHVYKYYLHGNEFFNANFRDLDSPQAREYFYQRDFFWNNYFNKEVYLGLYGLKVNGDEVRIGAPDLDCDDFVIKMKKIDASKNLSYLLHQNVLSTADCQNMGYQMTKMIAEFPEKVTSSEDYYSVTRRDVEDVRNWMYSADPAISRQQTDEIINKLNIYLENNQAELSGFPTKNYTISIDNHSDNIYYHGGKISFIDIYPPKEAWVFSHPVKNIYRPATDILILGGSELFESMLSGYEKYYGEIDRKHENFYLVYSACIQCVSLFNLSDNSELKKADAKKYWQFIEKKINKL